MIGLIGYSFLHVIPVGELEVTEVNIDFSLSCPCVVGKNYERGVQGDINLDSVGRFSALLDCSCLCNASS